VEPDYLPDSEVLFQPVFGSHFLMGGGVGGISPPYIVRGVQGGGKILEPPLGGFGGSAPEENFLGKFPCKIL
jgi:hypothetical protein